MIQLILSIIKLRLKTALCKHKQTNHSLFKSMNLYVYSTYCVNCGQLIKTNNYTEEQWNKGDIEL